MTQPNMNNGNQPQGLPIVTPRANEQIGMSAQQIHMLHVAKMTRAGLVISDGT